PALAELNTNLRDVIKWLSGVQKETGALTAIFMTVIDILKYLALGLGLIWTTLRSIATVLQVEVVREFELLKVVVLSIIKLFGAWWDTIRGIINGLVTLGRSAAGAADVMKALLDRDFIGAAGAYVKMMMGQADAIRGITVSVRDGVRDAVQQ